MMMGVVSRRTVQVATSDLNAVAEAAEVNFADRTKRAHVVRIEHGDSPAAPLARIEIAVPVAVGLRFVRLAHRDVTRPVGIGYVNRLDAVNAF